MLNRIVNFAQINPFLSLGLTFLFVLLFQSLNIFWGFEILDSGFHLTAYDNVFDAPDSVSYNFMYYLTNVIGGVIMKLFPGIGVVGFRIVGALFVDFSILLIFLSLRNEIPVIHLLIGGLLVVISYIQIPYSFNNGICSCFFYVCALLALYKGIVNEKILLILLSGVIVGVNIFSRIPNVLAVGLVLITLFHCYIEKGRLSSDWRSALFFILGILIGISLIALMIAFLGHQQAFMEALNILFQKGTSSSDTHSAVTLIWVQLYFYLNAVIPAALFFCILYISKLMEERLLWRTFFVGLASFTLFYHVYLNMGNESLWALCVVGCLLAICKRGQLTLLASLALFMLIVEVIGSNSGYNHGSLPALLAAPVASYVIINRRNLFYVLIVCFALFVKVIKQGNYLDSGPLNMKNFPISGVEECSLIKTTEVRAEVMNVSLPKIKQYVHSKDTLLVFGSAPIINYLTHTRPAGGMCWPGEGLFVKPFESAPKILIHKFGDFTEPAMQTFGIPTANQMINTYMQDHQYKIVWENPYFILLFPQK